MNEDINVFKKFIKEIYPKQDTISWQQLSISCDSYGSHDVYIGIYKNNITYPFWNPTDNVINIVKNIIKNKGELELL